MALTHRLEPLFAGFVSLHLLAIITTCVRLVHRQQRRQLWWDDFWASLALLGEAFIVILYLCVGVRDKETYPLGAQYMFNWLANLATPWTIWCARVCILTAIIRLLPEGRNRLVTRISFVFFVMFFLVVVLLRIFACGVPVPEVGTCLKPIKTAFINLGFFLVSTTWLVVWPIYILSRMKLPRTERRLIIACFASGVSLIAVDIGHAVNLTRADKAGNVMKYWQALNVTGNLQVIFAVLCANSLVLVTFVYRVSKRILAKRDPTIQESDSENQTSDIVSSTNDGTTRETRSTSTSAAGTHTTNIYTSVFNLTSMGTAEDYLTSGVSSDRSTAQSHPQSKPPLIVQVQSQDSSALASEKSNQESSVIQTK